MNHRSESPIQEQQEEPIPASGGMQTDRSTATTREPNELNKRTESPVDTGNTTGVDFSREQDKD
jgi:hypothetical protein